MSTLSFFLTDFQEKQKLWIEMLPLYKCLNSFFVCGFCFVFTREPNVLRPFSPFFFIFLVSVTTMNLGPNNI